MTGQILDRVLSCFRIGDPNGAYRIFDATGSTIAPGRWNTAGTPIIYTGQRYSTALLEKLVHGSGRLPPNQHYIRVALQQGLSYEVFSPPSLPGWDTIPASVSKAFGELWCLERRSVILLVPSIVARPPMYLSIPLIQSFRCCVPACINRSIGIDDCSAQDDLWAEWIRGQGRGGLQP